MESTVLLSVAIGVPVLLVYFAIRSARRAMERANYEIDLARCAAERERQLNRANREAA